ncbi:unnamed protein product [Prunus armeniaca]
MAYSYDKLLAKFNSYHKAAEQSNGAAPCHHIANEDVDMLCFDMPFAYIYVTDMGIVEEQVVVATEEDGAKDGATNEVAANLAEQVAKVDEQMAASDEQ